MSTAPPAGAPAPAYPGPVPTAYLTLDQAAELADTPAGDLEQLFRDGEVLGASYTADGRWVIHEDALRAWLATRS